jgi:hypothetical protein
MVPLRKWTGVIFLLTVFLGMEKEVYSKNYW